MIAWLRRNTLCRLNRHGKPILEGLDLPNGLCISMALCPHCRAELLPRVNKRLYATFYGLSTYTDPILHVTNRAALTETPAQ